MNARVGIFGGTFNPIHVGHLRAAEEVVEALDLERLIFVPCAEPPHKRGAATDPIAPAEARLAWVRLAVEGNEHFGVDPLEVERGGPSYSVDTLRAIGLHTRPELPVFVLGQDAFTEVGTWREPAALFSLAHFAVITRPPVAKGSLADWLPEAVRGEVELAPDGLSGRHLGAGTWLRVVEITALDVSASDIRRRLREGRSVRYLLPEGVRHAVSESGVYGQAA
jgi:nicotinate-nucleotide adenylyltransferase